jgi:nucleotide-binding universal stress UspA family protein
VHVVEPAFEGLRIQTSDLHAEAKQRSEEHLRQFAREHLGASAHPRALILEGRPADAICDAASAAGADLIIISNQGHSALAHALLGSVTERVVRHAKCAVLVVR